MLFRILTFFALSYSLLAGSAGVKNGSIQGQVVDQSGQPVAGANVVIVKDGTPPLIRGALSGANGAYSFPNVPIGLYTLGFTKYGFKSITTEAGDPEQKTAIGDQFRVYVESGAYVTAPKVTLRSLGNFGQATVQVKLVDAYSGDPIRDANVVLGGTATTGSFGNGEYQLLVNVNPSEDGPPELPLKVYAPGYEEFSEGVKPIANQVQELLVPVTPLTGSIEGRVDFSQFPGTNLAERTNISVPNIPSDLLNAQIDDTGRFSITVPLSTKNNKRSFDVTVHTKGFLPFVVRGVMAPEAGATTISQIVRLQAVTTIVTGQVVTTQGDAGVASGVNQAFITELGIGASINNGHYTFGAVPVGMPLTLKVFVMDRFGKVQTGETSLIAARNGTQAFRVPTVITSGGGSEDGNNNGL